MKNVKKMTAFVLLAVTMRAGAVALNGCAYGGVASTPDGTVVIVRNDYFLAGLLRKVYVCKVNGSQLACTETTAP